MGRPVETGAEEGHDPTLVGGPVQPMYRVGRAQVQAMVSVQVGLLLNKTPSVFHPTIVQESYFGRSEGPSHPPPPPTPYRERYFSLTLVSHAVLKEE
jgi:hypothetical protein